MIIRCRHDRAYRVHNGRDTADHRLHRLPPDKTLEKEQGIQAQHGAQALDNHTSAKAQVEIRHDTSRFSQVQLQRWT
ncbi:MAG: hypothetical protein GY862_29025 [Gammaproteobacteria bacterium]|nr:hypothetical protein [Gammaproteobacteria bacterium]